MHVQYVMSQYTVATVTTRPMENMHASFSIGMTATGHLHYLCTIKNPLTRFLHLREKSQQKVWSSWTCIWGFIKADDWNCTSHVFLHTDLDNAKTAPQCPLSLHWSQEECNTILLYCCVGFKHLQKGQTEGDTLCFLDFLLSSSSEWWWCLFSLCFFSECRWLDASSSSSISSSYLELSESYGNLQQVEKVNAEKSAKSNSEKKMQTGQHNRGSTVKYCRLMS